MNETLRTIHSMKTTHGDFSEKNINQTDLELILEASVQAANASARQSYSIIVLNDRNRMRELFGYQGSHALIYCVDFTRIAMTAIHLGHKFDNDDIIGFITGSVDTILAAQTAVIAATALGIESLITNGLHRKSLDEVYESLNLPQTSCFPLITVVLGYPKKERPYKKGRLSLEHVVHYDEYHLPSTDQLEKIATEYDDHSKHIGLIDNWEKMGFKRYLDWFYTKWTGEPPTKRTATGKILEFQERLIKSGFWWPVQ